MTICPCCTPFDCADQHRPYDPSRRHFLDKMMQGALGLGALGSGALPVYGADDPKDDRVHIGYLPITDATALLIAHANGYFKQQGLDAPKPTLIRGWSPLIEGFVGKKFNLVHFLKPIPIWMRYNQKLPVKVTGWAHTNGSAMVTGRHVKVDSYADLAGKQVAVPYWYSVHNIILQQALAKAGITPVIKSTDERLADDECNLQILPPPDMPIALAAKKIDAYTVAEPFNALGEVKAGAKMLRFTGDIWKNHPCCVISMHEGQASQNPAWSQAVMNAIVQAQTFATQNPKQTAEILSRDGKGYLPAPKEIVERAMTYYDASYYKNAIRHKDWAVNRIDFNGYPYPTATAKMVQDMKSTLVAGDTAFLADLDAHFVAKDLVNYTYITNAIQQFGTPDTVLSRSEVFEL